MKRTESTFDPIDANDEAHTLEPKLQQARAENSGEMQRWLEARNAKVGSSWGAGGWAERRTRRTLH